MQKKLLGTTIRVNKVFFSKISIRNGLLVFPKPWATTLSSFTTMEALPQKSKNTEVFFFQHNAI